MYQRAKQLKALERHDAERCNHRADVEDSSVGNPEAQGTLSARHFARRAARELLSCIADRDASPSAFRTTRTSLPLPRDVTAVIPVVQSFEGVRMIDNGRESLDDTASRKPLYSSADPLIHFKISCQHSCQHKLLTMTCDNERIYYPLNPPPVAFTQARGHQVAVLRRSDTSRRSLAWRSKRNPTVFVMLTLGNTRQGPKTTREYDDRRITLTLIVKRGDICGEPPKSFRG